MCAVAVGMCSWYPLASYAAPAAVANAAPGVQPQAATPAAPIVVGEPTATLAEPTAPAAVAENVPQREVKLSFATIAPPPGSIVLRGSRPDASVEFGMRSDELVANALLNLEYTPSPSLLPVQSQLKVYLNDELMGVLPVTKEQLGKKIRAQLPIDPLYITDFNRVRLEFVGHYRDVCENPASSTLWLDVGRESYLDLTYQSLKVNNDLSHFPVPFYDPRDNRPLKLPMIFPGSPAVTQQQAAAIVASWFGSKAGWRGQQFPVYFNELPDRNAIVFATNDKRPDFLRDHPPVKAPTIEMIDNPNDPYVKLLVIFGRDDNDLLLAAKGIAQGNILFRGSSVTVDGKPVEGPGPDRGIVFQQYALFPWLTVEENVKFGLKLQGKSKEECDEIANKYIKLVELQDFAKSYPKELSGGMKQRVAIARAYAVNPKVLLMDEPFGALDAQTRTQLQSELLETWEKEQKTCFFITHDVEEAIVLAQRVVIMYARPGRVKEVVDIDIPYPRTQETKMSPRFLELKNHIWSQVYQEYLSVRK